MVFVIWILKSIRYLNLRRDEINEFTIANEQTNNRCHWNEYLVDSV